MRLFSTKSRSLFLNKSPTTRGVCLSGTSPEKTRDRAPIDIYVTQSGRSIVTNGESCV